MKKTELIPSTTYGKVSLGLCIAVAVAVIVLESYVAWHTLAGNQALLEDTPARGIPVYLMIFLFSQIFQVILCWDAVIHQNTIQIIGFVVMNTCCLAYAIFQYAQLLDLDATMKPVLLAIIGVLAAADLLYAFLAYKLYLEFGWKIYKKIGADPHMKNMYRSYQIFLTLLKLDFFFFLAFSIQFLVLVLNSNDPEFALTIVAIGVTILVLFFAVFGLRRESKVVMAFFMMGCLLAIAYFIFKLVRVHDPTQASKYRFTAKYLTFFASLSLFCVIITLVNAVVCFLNFGKGLQEHIANKARGNNTKDSGANGDVKSQPSSDVSAPEKVDIEMVERK